MRISIVILIALLFTAFGSVSIAQDTQAILKQAQEICAEFEAQITDMHLVQTMTTATDEGEVTADQIVYTKGEKSRVEMAMQIPEGANLPGDDTGSLRTVMINNGTEAWMFSPFGGKQQLTPEEAERNAPVRNCWGFFPDNARITGAETVQGRECHIVEIDEQGVFTKLWLDKRNFIPVQGETRDSSGTESYRWVHSDFHTIHGDWEYPYRTEMYDGGALAATMNVVTLDVNKGVSDELFDPDKVNIPSISIEDLMKMVPPEPEDITE